MNGPALFQETQRFSPWVYVLLCVAAAILFGVLTMRQTTTVSPEAVTVRFGLALHGPRFRSPTWPRRRRSPTGRCATTAAGESAAPGGGGRSTREATGESC